MKRADKLTSPPIVGETYSVPCANGTIIDFRSDNKGKTELLPVLLPSHEDSKYFAKKRGVWKEGEEGVSYMVEELYYEADKDAQHHFHIDPRFVPANYYPSAIQACVLLGENLKMLHFTIVAVGPVKYLEMECLREMPPSLINFKTAFGKQFTEDYVGKPMKCGRCPHKGTDLRSMPVKNGVVTCPAHGLQFDSTSYQNLSLPKE